MVQITREEAHAQCLSRDCHCVNGKDIDSNYHEIIDKVFDYFEFEMECYRQCQEQLKACETALEEAEKGNKK